MRTKIAAGILRTSNRLELPKKIKVPRKIRNSRDYKGIIVTVTGYKYRPGIRTIKKEMFPAQYDDFLIFMALMMCAEFRRAIENQRYVKNRRGHTWKPLSVSYLSWKKKNNLSLDIWHATGQLKDSIKVFKKPGWLYVGFEDKDVYKDSGFKLNMIARYNEFGGVKQPRPPSRPLFRPITIYMRKHLKMYKKIYDDAIEENKGKLLYIKLDAGEEKKVYSESEDEIVGDSLEEEFYENEIE